VDLLAKAFVRLASEVDYVRLRIVGEGELRRLLERTLGPVRERVEFIGFKGWDELPREYAQADVLCVPSRYDGWGLVVPEGLASGLPVIATDRMGAALEFIKTGRNGWLVRAGDEEALLRAMRAAAVMNVREMREEVRESVRGHTLREGAVRFARFARESVLTGLQD
jgi:glycosyltransferase involved in cell wall biosynthesis